MTETGVSSYGKWETPAAVVEDLPPSTDELVAQGDRALAESHRLIARLDELLERSNELLDGGDADDPPSRRVIDLRESDVRR